MAEALSEFKLSIFPTIHRTRFCILSAYNFSWVDLTILYNAKRDRGENQFRAALYVCTEAAYLGLQGHYRIDHVSNACVLLLVKQSQASGQTLMKRHSLSDVMC